MIDENNWRCRICDYKGKFGQGDTINVHIKGAYTHTINEKQECCRCRR